MSTPNPHVNDVVLGNNQFALDLYAKLSQQEDGNLLMSPCSISTALAMTFAGARGDTEIEMAKVLHFDLPQDQLHPAFAAIIQRMNQGFGGKADFSGMTGVKDLYISAVIHKAFIDVNEEGTEAAAATAVVMTRKTAAVRPNPIFRADRPFLFLLKDTETNSILFIGRVMDPRSE